jgi:hypothetical protein
MVMKETALRKRQQLNVSSVESLLASSFEIFFSPLPVGLDDLEHFSNLIFYFWTQILFSSSLSRVQIRTDCSSSLQSSFYALGAAIIDRKSFPPFSFPNPITLFKNDL